MLGLSTKEILFKTIKNACYNCKATYKNAILENIVDFNNADENTAETLAVAIRRDYLDEVANSVINTFQISSPTVFTRIQLALMSPKLCGYEDINIDNGIMAGSVFAICYYAIKNRIAPPKMCIMLNHIQNDIMNDVLQEIAEEV